MSCLEASEQAECVGWAVTCFFGERGKTRKRGGGSKEGAERGERAARLRDEILQDLRKKGQIRARAFSLTGASSAAFSALVAIR
jgi:hypothetical protein